MTIPAIPPTRGDTGKLLDKAAPTEANEAEAAIFGFDPCDV